MSQQTRRTPDVFIEAVEAVYDAAPDPSRWPLALQAVAGCFDDYGANLIWQREGGGFGTIVSPSMIESQRDYVDNGWYLRDIRASRGVERSLWLRRDAITDADVVSDQEMDAHPIYTEFLARHGLRYVASIGLMPAPRTWVGLSVQRSAGRAPYDADELALLERIGKHAEKALSLTVRLLEAELQSLSLRDALDRLEVGVLGLRETGDVTFCNASATKLLRLGNSRGPVRLRDLAQFGAVERALRGLEVGGAADYNSPILVPRSDDARALVVYLLPASPGSPASEMFVETRALVLIVDPAGGEPPDPALVRDLLGLTLGEARVAALVGSGVTTRDAAARLGISEETVRTVLKRVFSKSGVSRQSELAALLSRLVIR
jgi:DNA-binding CsgD family transcriptional regulator/PAS domain-containing protein